MLKYNQIVSNKTILDWVLFYIFNLSLADHSFWQITGYDLIFLQKNWFRSHEKLNKHEASRFENFPCCSTVVHKSAGLFEVALNGPMQQTHKAIT